MFDRFKGFSNAEIQQIHQTAMEILADCGVRFHEPEALNIFKKHGFTVDGLTVHFTERQVLQTLSTAPDRFFVRARNPERSVAIGGPNFVLLPGYGAPFMADKDGRQRLALMEDYINFCKLNHTSAQLDMMGFLMVMPSDIPPQHSHLDMLLANIQHSDKAYMSSPQDRQKARENLEMSAILFGGVDNIKNKPVCVSKINPITPLVYSAEMAGSILEYAALGQPLQFPCAAMAGVSAPITLPGLVAVVTAEILAGVILTQLINPGTPCLFGGNCCATDMKTGAMALGSPESIIVIRALAQMAHLYGLPCKTGGSVTDSFLPDMQAGGESLLSLFMALSSGIHMLDQSVGILACFNAMGYEKFLIDEENAAYVRRVLRPEKVNESTLGLAQIKKVGPGGSFLTLKETVSLFRKESFTPKLALRENYGTWRDAGLKSIAQRAADALPGRLASYVKPDIDPGIERDLVNYVKSKK